MRSEVAQIRSGHVVRGRIVHKHVLAEMIDATLQQVTGAESSAAAWRSLLSTNNDVVGLKFNRSGAEGLGVTEPFADALITSLLEAGFEIRQIVAIEAPDGVYKRHGVLRPVHGWDEQPTAFASGQNMLANVLDQVTAIVNVPFLKTHNIAGFTCCLKNLSHALIKHLARFHGAHCAAFIADIVALPKIREKLRLNLVNALRVVFDRGPDGNEDFTWDEGLILAGRDPVACDSIGLETLNSRRSAVGLNAIDRSGPRTAYLRAASERGLGTANPYRIEVTNIRA